VFSLNLLTTISTATYPLHACSTKNPYVFSYKDNACILNILSSTTKIYAQSHFFFAYLGYLGFPRYIPSLRMYLADKSSDLSLLPSSLSSTLEFSSYLGDLSALSVRGFYDDINDLFDILLIFFDDPSIGVIPAKSLSIDGIPNFEFDGFDEELIF